MAHEAFFSILALDANLCSKNNNDGDEACRAYNSTFKANIEKNSS